MSDFVYGNDIYTAVCLRAGTTSNDGKTNVKRRVVRAYYDFLKLADWPFALADSPGVIDTEEAVEDTITVEEGETSAVITTERDGDTDNLTGWKLLVDTQQVEYRITAHEDGTGNITLDATWKEDDADTAACKIYKDEYSLSSSCLMPWSFYDRTTGREIDYDSTRGMFSEDEPNVEGDRIKYVSMIGHQKVRFFPFIEDAVTIVYKYTKTQSAFDFTGAGAGDTPVLPEMDRHVLADMVLQYTLEDFDQTRVIAQRLVVLKDTIRKKIAEMRQSYIKSSNSYGA